MFNEDVVKKYADFATKEDVNYLLFSLLDKERLSELARKSGLTRRTLYKLKERKDLRIKTKTKILKAAIETSPAEILDFLLVRHKDNTVGVLMDYLSYFYYMAIEAENAKDFEKALWYFLEGRRNNFGLISDEIPQEVNTMLRLLDETASNFKIEMPLETLKTTSKERLMRTLPSIFSDLYYKKNTAKGLAKFYDVPFEWTEAISQVTENIFIKFEEPEEDKLLTAATFYDARKPKISLPPAQPIIAT